MIIILLTLVILSYLIGSIPTGYIVTKYIKNIDLRQIGSGNVGATNVTRALGFKLGLLVAVLDISKGFVAIHLAQMILPVDLSVYYIFLVGLAAIIGHNWSIFLGFSGGKGVATTLGVVLNLLPISFLVFIIIWITITVFTRYVSLGSIMGAISLPISCYLFNLNYDYIIFNTILALSIILTHHNNIKRLLQGRENRMSWPPNS
jgi:glycerol-3-phosphate acyltransferase PlsY